MIFLRGYHHGDLRKALLREGLAMLSAGNSDELSLRALAREVGVSAPSVYRHFSDKEALLSALAREGLDRMAAMQRDSVSGEVDPKVALAATGRAYVRFAIANPRLFRLIFASLTGSAEVRQSGAFRMLLDHAAATLSPQADRDAVEQRAMRAWAVAHGLAMLMLDGQIPTEERFIELLITSDADR